MRTNSVSTPSEITVVYGPDYYKAEGLLCTGKSVRIGDITKSIFESIPMTPEPYIEPADTDPYPDHPALPDNIRLVFWIKEPGARPHYSKGCSRIVLSEVLSNPQKSEYIPLLKKALFLFDR